VSEIATPPSGVPIAVAVSVRARVRVALVLGIAVTLAACGLTSREPQVASVPVYGPGPEPTPAQFTATAYTLAGVTASGDFTREGFCAADPAILPFGTRIRVRGAGSRSGEYVVKDSGRKVVGRKIDLYIADDTAAKRFGKRRVSVEVLRYGSRH
jgi:3D (Asp-Asp-Asp) domain-containing protein